MNILAVTHYEMFFKLCCEANRAYDRRFVMPTGSGYANALNMAVLQAVRFEYGVVLESIRDHRKIVEDNREGFIGTESGAYADGYIAGCDLAIHILQGGV